jgi:hypothetical protein
MLPSGDIAWVRVGASQSDRAGVQSAGPADVGLRLPATSAAEVLKLRDFAETIRGVVGSVHAALDEHKPDSLTVEFGIEISATTGGLVSVVADVGASAHVRVSASWNKQGSEADHSVAEGSERP